MKLRKKLSRKKLDKKGLANVVVQLIIFLTIIPLVYVVGGYVVKYVIDALPSSELTPMSSQVITHIVTIWDWLPLILIVVAIIWAIAAAQRREPQYDVEE